MYKEVVEELRRKGTFQQNASDQSKVKKARLQLKIIDTLAVIFAMSGIALQYFLVCLT